MLFPRSVIFEATLFQQKSASLAFQGPFFPSKRTQERWVFMGTKVDQFPRFGGEHSESRPDSKFFLVNSPTTKTPQSPPTHGTHGRILPSGDRDSHGNRNSWAAVWGCVAPRRLLTCSRWGRKSRRWAEIRGVDGVPMMIGGGEVG